MLKYKATAAAIKSAIKPRPVFITTALAVSVVAAKGVSAADLVTNGSFEDPVVTYAQGWMSYYGENDDGGCEARGEEVCPEQTVPGWSVFWQDGSGPGRLELQRGFLAGASPDEGSQKAELDSHYRADGGEANIIIAQALQTCARTPYTLSYAWKARTDVEGDNDTLVLIDDEILLQHATFLPYWTTENYKFIANDSGFSGLAFTSVGTGNLLGMFIDDVSVTGADGSEPESCEPPAAVCGDKPAKLELLYDADLNGQDFYTQDPDEVSIESFYDPAEGLPGYVKIKVYDHFRKKDKRTVLFDALVRVGESFEIEGLRKKIPPRLFIDIYAEDGETLLQSVEFHTSCSQPLNVGDEFGAIAIWGFTP